MQVRTSTRFAVVTLSAALSISLSGCAAGNNAETRMTTQVTDGVDASIATMGSDIKARSILVVAQEDGSAVLIGSIFNGGDRQDELLGVTIGGELATLGEKSYPISKETPLHFAGMVKNSSALIPKLNAVIGSRIKVQFFFGRGGELSLTTLVREKTDEFAAVGDTEGAGA